MKCSWRPLALGVHGAIGSTYNYMAPVYQAMLEAIKTGEEKTARRWQYFSVQVVEILFRHRGAIAGGKALMALSGLDLGPTRKPLETLEVSESRSLQKELNAIGFFEKVGMER